MAVSQMVLPNGVVTRADVGRLAKETELLDGALNAATIRGNGAELPKTSKMLDETAQLNKLNLLQAAERKDLLGFLQKTRSDAPTIHISFNTDPSPAFQQKLITWIRQEINPAILLHIGLNPNIGAGCVVRTSNKYFDFSLRQRFTKQRDLLIAKLQGDETVAPAATEISETPQTPPVATPAATEPVLVPPVAPVAVEPTEISVEIQPAAEKPTETAA